MNPILIKLRLLIFFISYCNISWCFAASVFYTKGADNPNDFRFQYVHKVLKLALEKTSNKYGNYQLKPYPKKATIARLLLQLEQEYFDNFFLKMSITDDILEKYHVIPFPIDRGIAGYRVSFISTSKKESLCHSSFNDILTTQTIVQGIGWLDSKILTYNGYRVISIGNFESMFKMVNRYRVNLFPRGINELLKESSSIEKYYPDITIEPCVMFYYPLPRFFITSKKNIKNAQRIQEGLEIAYEDGSFITLWQSYFLKSIEFSQLRNRKLITLENPYIKTLDPSYQKYNYHLPINNKKPSH